MYLNLMMQIMQLCKKTIEMNNLKNIVTEKYVLGNSECNVFLSNEASMSSIDSNSEEFNKKQITLDAYVKEKNINVGLIKVDIEGYEKKFLLGAKQTIISQKPKLLISIYHHFEQFFEIKPLLESWGINYKYKIAKPVDGSILLETVLIAETY